MEVKDCNLLPELKIITPKSFGDNRGYFMESYSKRKFEAAGLNYDFVQDNHSYSQKCGTFRGIHCQVGEFAQSKLVRCTRGKILDYGVDLRKNSPTYLKWVFVELSAENRKQLLLPRGFGHAFLTLTDDVEVQYKTDAFYSPEHDRVINYADKDIHLGFPNNISLQDITLSDKDRNAPFLKDIELEF